MRLNWYNTKLSSRGIGKTESRYVKWVENAIYFYICTIWNKVERQKKQSNDTETSQKLF